MTEFEKLVKQMRMAQDVYLLSRAIVDLEKANELERQVDAELRKLEVGDDLFGGLQ